jgi:hypothetical protein
LLITEAGGMVGRLNGGENKNDGDIVVGTPKVYAPLLELQAPHVPPDQRTRNRARATSGAGDHAALRNGDIPHLWDRLRETLNRAK